MHLSEPLTCNGICSEHQAETQAGLCEVLILRYLYQFFLGDYFNSTTIQTK